MTGEGGGGLPVIAAVAQAERSAEPSSLKTLAKAVAKIGGYMLLGVLLYTFPEINVREPDADPEWDWDFVDCIYAVVEPLESCLVVFLRLLELLFELHLGFGFLLLGLLELPL